MIEQEEKERKLMDVIVYSDGKTADIIFYNSDGSIKDEWRGVLLKNEYNFRR